MNWFVILTNASEKLLEIDEIGYRFSKRISSPEDVLDIFVTLLPNFCLHASSCLFKMLSGPTFASHVSTISFINGVVQCPSMRFQFTFRITVVCQCHRMLLKNMMVEFKLIPYFQVFSVQKFPRVIFCSWYSCFAMRLLNVHHSAVNSSTIKRNLALSKTVE